MARINRSIALHLSQTVPGATVAVIQQWRRQRIRSSAVGEQCTGIASFGIVLRARNRNLTGFVSFREARIEQVYDRYIQAVEPDDGVGTIVSVIVPRPAGGDDEVAPRHLRALAVNRRVGV